MLSQKVLQALSLSRSKIVKSSFLPISTSSVKQNENPYKNYNYDGDPVKYTQEHDELNDRQLKEWRESFPGKTPFVPIDSDHIFFQMFRTKIELTPWGIKKYLKKSITDKQRLSQHFIPERQKILGADLALAYFLVYIGGKVKFKGNDEWYFLKSTKEGTTLPQKYDPSYVVTEIDASDCVLYYEGLENFQDCPRVKSASFARCPEIDDWCVDRIAHLFPFLKHLDLSDCPKVSERGLEALYKTGMLETLIVTNHYKSAAFELTCMMLEDIVPGLQVDIREPKEKMEPPMNPIE